MFTAVKKKLCSNHQLKGTEQNLGQSVMQTSIQTWEISRAELQ